MALLTCDFFSEALERGTSMTVVLPQPTEEQIGVAEVSVEGPPPVLYLLHGLSDDHSAWLRFTSIERYAAARGLAVVMPAVDRSFYANEAHGHAYWDFVSDELPRVVAQFLQVSQDPAETLRGRPVDGRLRRAQARLHPSRAVRRGRVACPASSTSASSASGWTGPRSWTGCSTACSGRRTTSSSCWQASTRSRHRGSTSGAAPRRTG